MAIGQSILTQKTRYAIFLTLTVNDGGEDRVRDTLEGLSGRLRSVSSRAPEKYLTVVAGIGSNVWGRLFSGARPKLLRPFREYVGDPYTAPATPGDVLLHIRADEMDLCYEVGHILTDDFGDSVSVVEEIHGFRYFDLRDITGFVDGTENPTGAEAAESIIVTAADDPDFAGGSYITTQRYVTDLPKWNSVTVEEQERVFGRSKSENIEMGDEKPTNAHTALNQVFTSSGTQLKIVRENMPYATIAETGEKGTFYIAYAKTPEVTDEMLRKMFIGDPPGNYDALLDFTTAVTGNEWFAPCAEFLDALPPAPSTMISSPPVADRQPIATAEFAPTTGLGEPAAPAVPPAAPTAPGRAGSPDGSLGIGGLRRRS